MDGTPKLGQSVCPTCGSSERHPNPNYCSDAWHKADVGHIGGRINREFHYTNEDGQEGFVVVSFGPWGASLQRDAPIMVSFDDAVWMGVEQAEDFQRWFRSALAEAKRKHVPNVEDVDA